MSESVLVAYCIGWVFN